MTVVHWACTVAFRLGTAEVRYVPSAAVVAVARTFASWSTMSTVSLCDGGVIFPENVTDFPYATLVRETWRVTVGVGAARAASTGPATARASEIETTSHIQR